MLIEADGRNAKLLKAVENSLFVRAVFSICLKNRLFYSCQKMISFDNEKPETENEVAALMHHNRNGTNRFWDKVFFYFSIIIVLNLNFSIIFN